MAVGPSRRSGGLRCGHRREVESPRFALRSQAADARGRRSSRQELSDRCGRQRLHSGRFPRPATDRGDWCASSLVVDQRRQDVANKALIAPFQRTASLVPFAFARRSARDFKPLYGIKLEGQGILEQLGADGEIKHATLTDSEYSVQLNTYAKMLGINRKMMINDDLGAFSKSRPSSATWRSRRTRSCRSDDPRPGGSFYGASNSFSGSALSLTSLKTQYNLFLAQTDAGGYPISVMPDRMLCPAALGFDMRANLNSEYVVSGNTTAAGGETRSTASSTTCWRLLGCRTRTSRVQARPLTSCSAIRTSWRPSWLPTSTAKTARRSVEADELQQARNGIPLLLGLRVRHRAKVGVVKSAGA